MKTFTLLLTVFSCLLFSCCICSIKTTPPSNVAGTSTSANDSSICNLNIQNSDPSVQDVIPLFQKVFKAACPILVKRFAYRPDVASDVRLTFKHSQFPEYVVGNDIVFDINWLAGKPKNRIGVLIHATTHVIQQPFHNAPSWFIEGMATYGDSVYSPISESPPFPDSAGQSYKDGYGTTARFLHWLEQHTTPDIVDQLNHANQADQSFSATFQRLTGGTVDQLWDQYKANPKLGPTRRIPISI